ncbi:MAG: filamentous hemagglutinin N-terminal domain-containing protein, partial [Cyanobacteria bacterium P01_A01_bin.83]
MQQSLSLPLSLVFLAGSYLSYTPAIAQITPDGTTSTTVNVNGDIVEINDGDIAGGNLFHSFQDFSVPNGGEAAFNNPDIIENIFSRVTGGNMSNIDGLIRANGNANLFLINPAGIIFGEGARLDLGGSFYGSTADSILFPDNIEFSASNLNSPVLTINAPIGLGFRDNPGEVINRSQVTDDTGEDLIGLRVTEDQTLALIGGDVSIEGGLITAFGGRIELGSIRENSNVSLTPIGGGFDIGYEEVVAFRDISLSNAALVTVNDANTTDIEVQGRNISLSQGSLIGITGQTGKIDINASESLSLDGNAAEVDLGNFPTAIFSRVSGDFTEETPSINIDTSKLSLTNGAQIEANNDIGAVQGVDININASEIILETLFERDGLFFVPVIASQVFEEGTGNGGNINITTATLTLNDGAQITTDTFGSGNGGDLIVNASESIELNGTIPDEINTPSALFANVGIPFFPISSAGNAGDITINTPQLTVSNGAQIATTAQNNGNGGNITFNISDSILITGTSPSAELGGTGRSGIFVNVEPSFEEFITDFDTGEETLTGEIIPTTGNGG